MTTSAFIASLTTNSSLLALWGALLLHRLLPIPYQLHPLRIWHQVALLVATRVNHPHENYSQRSLRLLSRMGVNVANSIRAITRYQPISLVSDVIATNTIMARPRLASYGSS